MAHTQRELSKPACLVFSVARHRSRKGLLLPSSVGPGTTLGQVWFRESWRPIMFLKPALSKGLKLPG